MTKNTLKTMIVAAILTQLLTGCDTLSRNLTANRMQHQYHTSLQAQREQQFRMQISTALQAAAGRLTMNLYDRLGKGGEADNTFEPARVNYNYQEGTASVDVQVYWKRRNGKEVIISGYLNYHQNGQTSFVCTGTKGTRGSDRSYIRKLTEGIYI